MMRENFHAFLTLPPASSSLHAMKVIRHTDADFPDRLREVTAPSSLFDAEIEQRTRAILDAVHVRGDDAVLEFTEKFDGAKLDRRTTRRDAGGIDGRLAQGG